MCQHVSNYTSRKISGISLSGIFLGEVLSKRVFKVFKPTDLVLNVIRTDICLGASCKFDCIHYGPFSSLDNNWWESMEHHRPQSRGRKSWCAKFVDFVQRIRIET